MTAKTATPMVSRAIEKWRACGLTPVQIRSELESLARNLETDRARLIEALRQCCTALQPLVDDEASERRVGIAGKAHGRAYDLLRELGVGE